MLSYWMWSIPYKTGKIFVNEFHWISGSHDHVIIPVSDVTDRVVSCYLRHYLSHHLYDPLGWLSVETCRTLNKRTFLKLLTLLCLAIFLHWCTRNRAIWELFLTNGCGHTLIVSHRDVCKPERITFISVDVLSNLSENSSSRSLLLYRNS